MVMFGPGSRPDLRVGLALSGAGLRNPEILAILVNFFLAVAQQNP